MTRLKANKKAKRWGKGQSSSSNPSLHKFRNEAKSRRMGPQSTKSSSLTTKALARHDNQSDVSTMLEDDGSTMAGSRSVRSGWTIGTEFTSGAYDGTAFQHVQKLWNSSLASHKQVAVGHV